MPGCTVSLTWLEQPHLQPQLPLCTLLLLSWAGEVPAPAPQLCVYLGRDPAHLDPDPQTGFLASPRACLATRILPDNPSTGLSLAARAVPALLCSLRQCGVGPGPFPHGLALTWLVPACPALTAQPSLFTGAGLLLFPVGLQ